MVSKPSQAGTKEVSVDTMDAAEVVFLDKRTQKERIVMLKQAKEDQQYTIQRIKDEVLKNGDTTSDSTLKRIFAPGSEDDKKGFTEYSLLVVEKVLRINSTVTSEIMLLKAELHVQMERVERLQDHVRLLEDRVNFLKDQIDIKDRRMDERETALQKVIAERDNLRKRLEEMGKVL